MKIEISEITEVLRKQGWQEMPLSDEAKRSGLTLLCISPFAVLGVALFNSAGEIQSRWAECQDHMSRLRRDDAVGKTRDLYLVFVAQNADVAAEAQLQPILGDTHVCRKLYIVSNGQPVGEVIQNIPWLRAMPQTTDSSAGKVIPLLESLNLHGDLKRDLATRSPARILEKLLTGKYKQPEKRP